MRMTSCGSTKLNNNFTVENLIVNGSGLDNLIVANTVDVLSQIDPFKSPFIHIRSDPVQLFLYFDYKHLIRILIS
jgi:hypothetical protein